MDLSRKLNRDNIISFFLVKLRAIWHLFFWVAAFIVLLSIFSSSGKVRQVDLVYTIVFLFPIAAGVYLNLYLLIPLLLKRQKVLFFLLAEVLLIFVVAGMLYLTFDRWIDHILKNYFFVSYDKFLVLLLYAAVFICLSTMIKLSKEWLIILQLQGEENLSRLKHLQSQVNPHFLLNSLQTIYSLSLEGEARTPATILQLSEILKFTIYESGEKEVLLEREIEVLRDYTEIYRLRQDPERTEISFNVTGTPGDLRVAPMLFLPFIENSFKHGLQGSEKEAFVRIDFQVNEKIVTFTVENSMGHSDRIEKGKYHGSGIRNTQKRLELVYPDRHRLDISGNGQTYKVTLLLEL